MEAREQSLFCLAISQEVCYNVYNNYFPCKERETMTEKEQKAAAKAFL